MTLPVKHALVIQNPASGRRKERRLRAIESARRELLSAGITTELASTSGPGSATALARRAVGRTDLVIACGGDGTINEVVNGLAGSSAPLAILPAGTANVLAKELGIPWHLREAARLIPSMEFRRIALGTIEFPATNGDAPRIRYFLSLAGAGPDGELVRCVHNGIKHHTGTLAYWLEGLRQLFRYRFPPFRIRSNAGEKQARLVVIGRTKHYGGPFRITTGASLFEDSFELMTTNSPSPLQYIAWLPSLWLGRLRSDPRVQFWKASDVTCEALNGRLVYAQADGEPLGPLPLRFRIVPDALTICVPPAAISETI